MAKNKGAGKKAAAPKQQNRILHTFWNKHWAKILAVVVVFGILGFIGINKLIIYNQKQQFDAAEASLDALHSEIITQVGQPTSSNKEKSCSYRSVKIGQGERSCGISYTSVYSSVTDKESARNLAKKIESLLVSIPSLRITNQGTNYEEPYVDKEGYKSSDELSNSDTRIWCYASYELDPNSISNPSKFILILGCSDKAHAEFYPVKN